MTDNVTPIKVPQVNVNDESVKIVAWHVNHGMCVEEKSVLCEVETVKSVDEIYAKVEGVVYHIHSEGEDVRVSEIIGYIGKSVEAIEKFLQVSKEKEEDLGKEILQVTPKASVLMEKYNISQDVLMECGIKGRIKEKDVLAYLKEKGLLKRVKEDGDLKQALPDAYYGIVMDKGAVPVEEAYMMTNMRSAKNNTLITTMEMDLDTEHLDDVIQSYQNKDMRVSALHIVILALAKTFKKYDKFLEFIWNNKVYRYKNIDIGFIVTTFSEKLYAPVLRGVDQLSLQEIAQRSQDLFMAANRNQLASSHLGGTCFAISYILDKNIKRFVALTDKYQSGILSMASSRQEVRLLDGNVCSVSCMPMTLSYDHSLIDGVYASKFLSHLKVEINQIELI